MSTIKNIVGTVVSVTATAVAWVIGTNAGKTVWENGLGEKVAEKTSKWFSKE
jgi:hypothetical protein